MDPGHLPPDQSYLDRIDLVIDNIVGDDIDFSSDGNISNDAFLANSEDLWLGAESSPNDFESPGRHGQTSEASEQATTLQHQFTSSSIPNCWASDSFQLNGDSISIHTPTTTSFREILPQTPIGNTAHPSSAIVDKGPATPSVNPGTRLNRDSVRILKKWLSDHGSHPYADDTDKRILQDQTGLSKTQIANWLANARRRGKMPSSRSSSKTASKPIDVPARPATPAVRGSAAQMNPLQRWVDSPPEHEPASASAIARAVASSSSFSPRADNSHKLDAAQDGSEKSSCHASSATSLDSSCSSGGSFASATSQLSQSSLRPFARPRTRRRKRGLKTNNGKTSLATVRKTYQCTFCTETFGAKHDWHRHEHTLHLPLERWVCAPEGPSTRHASSNASICVFCGQTDPDDAHTKHHNYAMCQDRSIHWRTFNRKDHLNQHLRLVHNAKFTDQLMKKWKVPMPEIRSRCGFCEAPLESWDARVNHLAHHFKAGKTMADWKGGWGFEPHIQLLVENSIPPYFIETERNSPFPFEGSRALAETPRSAYELIKLELAYFMQNHFNANARMPTSDEMQLEACRIILASEAAYQEEISYNSSWLLDLITSDQAMFQKAKFGPMRSPAESRLFSIKITGKNSLFEGCPFEAQLRDFVATQQTLGLAITQNALKEEACYIVGRMEEVSTTPSDFIATWLVKLIHSSAGWLPAFASRVGVLGSLESHDEGGFHATIREYTKLEREMAKYIAWQRAIGIEPTDENLRRQAQIIVHGSNPGCDLTAADDHHWLSAFKQRHLLLSPTTDDAVPISETLSAYPWLINPESNGAENSQLTLDRGDEHAILEARSVVMKAGSFFISDPNFYRWITEELARWVKGTMSPQNPNCHVPSDAEIQHYARWITYNDDDPLNQTIAENQDWLRTFKRDMGILDV